MNYTQCLSYFENILLNKTYDLEPIKELLQRLGNPQNDLKVIHLAGTNGKGSISNLLKNVLLEEGYTIGLYNSPFIISPRETIICNNLPITEEAFEKLANTLIAACRQMVEAGFNHPSSFECYTALALKYFAEIHVDYAIIEVGLGGKDDATNVFESPLVSVITAIDYDHMAFLGNTIEAIATAKSGIIKKEVPVVISPNSTSVLDIIHGKASELNAPIYQVDWKDVHIIMYEDNLKGMSFSITSKLYNYPLLQTSFIGEHQLMNIATMLTILYVLTEVHHIKITNESTTKGIFNTYWPCRCEYIENPQPILIDGAHNVSSMESFVKVLNHYCAHTPLTLLFGVLSDKDINQMLSQIANYSQVLFVTRPLSTRSLPASTLEKLAQMHFPQVYAFESIDAALEAAMAYSKKHSTLLCCVGSLYLAMPVRNKILNISELTDFPH